MTNKTETPRTDREVYKIGPNDIGFDAINPALCRILERELTAKFPVEWIEEELKDGDRICIELGLERTEGGRLPMHKILASLRGRIKVD